MKRYGLVGEYDLFIDELDDGEYYGADEVDDTIAKQQAELAILRTAPTDNGIPVLDKLCDQYNKEEINLSALVCNIWNVQQAEIDELVEFIIWMTGCGYDFCKHKYFTDFRDRHLKHKGE